MTLSESCSFSVAPREAHKFTGKERDSESGLDYFEARHYSPSLGRFMVPDPADVDSANPFNPPSWNLYAYALNNPVKFSDPTGLWCYYGTTDDNGQPDLSNPDATSRGNYDFHSNQTECEGHGGSWYNDWAETATVNGGPASDVATIVTASNVVPMTIQGPHLSDCIGKGAEAVGKELIGYDIANYLVGKVDDWAMAHSTYPVISPNASNPVGQSSSSSTSPSTPTPSDVAMAAFSAHALEAGAEAIHGNPAVKQTMRQALRAQGWKVSTKAVGKFASELGERAGAAGGALATYTFVESVRGCMGD